MHNLKTARSLVNLKQGRNDWYKIKNVANGNAEIYIYDEIGYWGVTAQDFINELKDINADNIDLHLNTPGGEVFDGLAIYNSLKDHKATVTTYVDSLAASAGSFIAMAGDTVIMQKTAQMMIHDGMTLAIGNADDLTELIGRLNKTSDILASIYADRAGGTADEWRTKMKAETWFNAEEAVNAGLADKINGVDTEESKTDNSWDLSIYAYAGRDKAPAPVVQNKASFDSDEFRRLLKGNFA